MIKALIKEVFIILLLTIAIMLVLGILFYEYRPSTYKIPVAVQEYGLPEEMQEELDETIQATGTQNIIQIYRIDSNDLEGYEKTNDYEAGKINPFAGMSKPSNNTTDNNTPQNNTTNGEENNETNSAGTGSQGNFLNTIK